MTAKKITFQDKEDKYPVIDQIRQVSSANINEIKSAIGDHADKIDLLDENVFPLHIEDNYVGIDKLTQEVRDFIGSQGNMVNYPDEEDLYSTDDIVPKLKLKDRSNYKFIRSDFDWTANLSAYANFILEIRSVHDVGGGDITLPDNVTLCFSGGIIANVGTFTGLNTKITSDLRQIFDSVTSFGGRWVIRKAFPQWFGALGDGINDDTKAIQDAIDISNHVYIPSGNYNISSSIILNKHIRIEGENRISTTIQTSNNIAIFKYLSVGYYRLNISNIRGIFIGTYDEPDIFPTNVAFSDTCFFRCTNDDPGNTGWFEQSVFSDIEVYGAWTGFYNKSGAWDIRFDGLFIWHCSYGITWNFGTTVNMRNVLVNSSIRAFYFFNVFNLQLSSIDVDEARVPTENAAIYLISCSSVGIMGLSSEACQLIGHESNFYRINNCQGVDINGAYFISLNWDGTGGAYMQFLNIYNNSKNIKISNYQVPQFSDLHTHSNSPAQISFILDDGTTLGDIILENCKFDNITAVGASATSVYFIQEEYIKSHGNIFQGFNFAIDRGYLLSDLTPNIGYSKKGVVVYKKNYSNGDNIGWICIVEGDPGTWKMFGISGVGATADRPPTTIQGYSYFDTTISKDIWFNGTVWIESDGVISGTLRAGSFASRPTVASNLIYVGFEYFCTDKQTSEGTVNGIPIYHKGANVWVDSLGRVVS